MWKQFSGHPLPLLTGVCREMRWGGGQTQFLDIHCPLLTGVWLEGVEIVLEHPLPSSSKGDRGVGVVGGGGGKAKRIIPSLLIKPIASNSLRPPPPSTPHSNFQPPTPTSRPHSSTPTCTGDRCLDSRVAATKFCRSRVYVFHSNFQTNFATRNLLSSQIILGWPKPLCVPETALNIAAVFLARQLKLATAEICDRKIICRYNSRFVARPPLTSHRLLSDASQKTNPE